MLQIENMLNFNAKNSKSSSLKDVLVPYLEKNNLIKTYKGYSDRNLYGKDAKKY